MNDPKPQETVSTELKQSDSTEIPRSTDAEPQHPQPSQAWRIRWRVTIVMSIICTGGLVTALDGVIIGTALPSIARELGATTNELAWIGASYLLASALLQPIWPTLSELTGRQLAFDIGFMLFFAGSLVAALAQAPGVLVAGRTIQGLGAGNIILLCNVLMSDLFPLRERGLYIGIYAAASCFGAALGPVLGGLLTSYLNWRWCFWINLPFSGVALVVLTVLLDLPKLQAPASVTGLKDIDWVGSALVAAATTLLLVGLQFGGVVLPWNSAAVIGLLIGGCVATLLFLVQESKHRQPIIPPRIFSTPSSAACLAVAFLHGTTYIACLYYLPIYFQLVLRASPVESGVWLLIIAVPMSLITVAAALVIRNTGRYRPAIWLSASILTLGVGISIAFPASRNWSLIVIVQLLLAIGIGPLFQSPLLALQAATAPEDVSRANGAFVFMRTISSGIGLVMGQVLLQNQLQSHISGRATLWIPHGVLDRIREEVTALASISDLSAGQQDSLREALGASLSRVWMMYTATAGACLLASLLIKHHPMSIE
jgi:MFS family permease